MKLIQRVCPNHIINQVNRDPIMASLMGLMLQDIKDTYQDVFEGLKLHLKIKPDSSPLQLLPRKIPESLKQPLWDHLDELVKLNMVELVNCLTDWVSTIMVTTKTNGKIRLCLDPWPLNKVFKRCRHPMPTIEDVLPELSKAKVFTKLTAATVTGKSPLPTSYPLLGGQWPWSLFSICACPGHLAL